MVLLSYHIVVFRARVLNAASSCLHAAQTVAALLNVPMTKKRKRITNEEEKLVEQVRGGAPPFPPSYYALSFQEMQANGYPVPTLGSDGKMHCPDGYVATQPAGEGGASHDAMLVQ